MSDAQQYHREAVKRSKAACKRCGSSDVAWRKSSKGKWYLIEVFTDPRDNGDVGSYLDFHSNYCGKPELHNQEQEQITLKFQAEKIHRDVDNQRLHEERVQREIEMARAFDGMTPSQREELIAGLRNKIDQHSKDWVSMDFMTEHMRWRMKGDALRSELAFYEDLKTDLADGGKPVKKRKVVK